MAHSESGRIRREQQRSMWMWQLEGCPHVAHMVAEFDDDGVAVTAAATAGETVVLKLRTEARRVRRLRFGRKRRPFPADSRAMSIRSSVWSPVTFS